LNKSGSKIITGVRYIYLIVFFALLAGLFHPLITGASFDTVVVGVMILFVGLAGGVLVYKAGTTDKRRGIFLGAGLGLIALSLVFISQLTGRF
jgi:peptidoglycan/LPS O-acetylase OafA/YrhL